MSTAVIVEPRRHPALKYVLQNMVSSLPSDWSILIFHGKDNNTYVQTILENMEDPTRFLKPIQLDTQNLSLEQYNQLLMSQAFYRAIPTESMLIFQTDTLILEPTQIQEFLEYDYVGAPWKSGIIGNGGLSFRKKSRMLAVISAVVQFNVNEDVYFSTQPVIPLKKPTFEMAKRFAVETVFYPSPFGIHAPWKHLTPYQMEQLTKKYPAIHELIHLQF